MSFSRRILYVDDDAGLRRLVSRALERRGYSVALADSADAAMEAIEQNEYDLVAIDHQMPGKDGMVLLSEITALKDAPPVVFVTGSDDTQLAVTALKSGADDFVVKAIGDDFFDLLANSFEQTLSRVALRRAKERVEDELRAANARLEALLGEVHHRVANSLQLVSTFVSMQATQANDAATAMALEETQRRIRAVGQVHRSLYTSQDVEFVELDKYVGALLDALSEGFANESEDVEISYDFDPVSVKPDQAVSIGVLVTELVSNAIKYAYPAGEKGAIKVALRSRGEGQGFRVEVCDDGIGFADGDIKGTGLGMRIVKAMAMGLGSELTQLPRERGTHFSVSIKG